MKKYSTDADRSSVPVSAGVTKLGLIGVVVVILLVASLVMITQRDRSSTYESAPVQESTGGAVESQTMAVADQAPPLSSAENVPSAQSEPAALDAETSATVSSEVAPAVASLGALTGVAREPVEGLSQAIDPARHPQAQSTYQALADGTHPERSSSLIMPPPFDRVAYEADPELYLSVSEPGRIWQSKQPGPGVPSIQAFGPTRHRISTGESTRLMVRAEPNMPVSFASSDLGTFEANGLPSITVQADEQGYAAVTFLASGGAIADVRILAASPTSAGQLTYVVVITE